MGLRKRPTGTITVCFYSFRQARVKRHLPRGRMLYFATTRYLDVESTPTGLGLRGIADLNIVNMPSPVKRDSRHLEDQCAN